MSKGLKLREVVFKLVPSLHNPVIDHIIIESGANPNTRATLADVENLEKLALKCKLLIEEFSETPHKGYLVVSDRVLNTSKKTKPTEEVIISTIDPIVPIEEEKKTVSGGKIEEARYFDFSPLVLSCHSGKKIVEMDSYNHAIDTFFRVMAAKIHEEANDVESIAWKKYENIKND